MSATDAAWFFMGVATAWLIVMVGRLIELIRTARRLERKEEQTR